MGKMALLIGNTAKSSDPEFNVDLKQLRKNIGNFKKILENLGDFRFNTAEIINEKRDKAEVQIKNAIRRYSQELAGQQNALSRAACLLIYYFGHGVQRRNDLCFVFKDSKTDVYPSLLPFNTISELIEGYNIPRVIFILDSCYAGAVYQKVNASLGANVKYYVIASTIPTHKSSIMRGNSPFGAFSLVLFEGLLDPDASQVGTQKITPHSLYDYVRKKFQELEINQDPYKYDGGLDTFPITEVTRTIVVDPRFNWKAPKRCFYQKLCWIISKIRDSGNRISVDALYKIVLSTKPEELLTPIWIGERYENRPVSESTFKLYVQRLKNLKIVADDEPLRLTKSGLSLLAKGESEFNIRLFDLIEAEFKRFKYSFEKLDNLVRFKTHIRGIPSAANLYSDAKSKDNISIDSEWFAILIDLLAQAGYLKYSSQRTYFPY